MQDDKADVDMLALNSRPDVESFVAGASPKGDEAGEKLDLGNIAEAELSLRERGSLNYEEARALLGKIEYQKGNIAPALQVFEGIDVASVKPKLIITLSGTGSIRRRQHQPFSSSPLSAHGVNLLFEAFLLKANSLQLLNRLEEAAQSCKLILDIVESSFPQGFPENLPPEFKFQDIVIKAVGLLPELWKRAGCPRDSIISYRRAFLYKWTLPPQTLARLELELCVILLYGGYEASSHDLRSQMNTSFVPRNNVEEAILLLMILLRKAYRGVVDWDPSILDHLAFALSISSETPALASEVEKLLPGFVNRREGFYILALCYHGAGEGAVALNLLKKLLHEREDPENVPALLLASKICSENSEFFEEGIVFCNRALRNPGILCSDLEGIATFLLGVSLSSLYKSSVSHHERAAKQAEALQMLESAATMMNLENADVVYHLALENAHQRKMIAASRYARELLKLENGSDVRGWILLARILSAQQEFASAESIINAALDQTCAWDQGELLRTKAKLQIAKGEIGDAIQTYIQLLASLKVQNKNFRPGNKGKLDLLRRLEMEVWHDLASVYISMSRWSDAEACLANSKALGSYSAVSIHISGLLSEKRGAKGEALRQFMRALDVETTYAPSLVSAATMVREVGSKGNGSAVVKCFLMEALREDRMNYAAWYNLGLIHRDEGGKFSSVEAAHFFQSAVLLQETAPLQPF